jgi:ABC-type bacteriocin/lantibiotic exporter with double-glycine peptidase domain
VTALAALLPEPGEQVAGTRLPAPKAAVLAALAPALGVTYTERDETLTVALQRLGVMSRPVTLPENWQRTVTGPMVGFAADDGRPVALVPRRRGYRVVATGTPDLGPVALALYRPLPDSAVSSASLLRFAVRGTRADLLRLALAGLGAAVLGIGVPISAGMLIPRLQLAPHPLVWTLVLLSAAVLAAGAALLVRNAAAVRVQGRIQAALEPAIWARLLAHDVDFFRDYSTGDLVHRANAIATARQALSDALIGSVLGAFFSITGLAVLVAVTPVLGAALLGCALLAGAVLLALARRRQRHESVVVAAHGEIHGILYGLLRGIDKIRTAGRERAAFAQWAAPFSRMKSADAAAMRIEAMSTGVVAALQGAFLAVLLAVVALRGSAPSIATLLAAGVAAGQVALALGQVANSAAVAYGVAPAIQRLAPVLAPPKRDIGVGADPGRLSGAVELRGVGYAYPDAAEASIQSLWLHAEPGEFVAVVGPTGAGKSTLIRLLLGFDNPTTGSVRFDGRDLADLDLRRVRQQIGSVLQHGRMLQGSLLDNIAGPSAEVDEADVWAAAELAGIDGFIHRLPMGLRTKIGENAQGFSGGQVQRLLIARALVRRPPILLLDEATSALDNATQARVAERIAALDCTRIVIAHRLSTIRRADRIYVMEQGRVRASGSYDDLLDTDALFTRLVRPQEL